MKVSLCQQQGEQWEALRATRPTASEYKRIFTGGGKRSSQREQYMRELSIASKYKIPGFEGNQWTDRGNELEPIARDLFIEKTGFNVREVGFCEKDNLIAGGSPDFLIYRNESDPIDKPVAGGEIKCLKLEKHLAIIDKKAMPLDYKTQVHGSMWYSDTNVWVFISYCPEAVGMEFYMMEILRDNYTERLGEELELFCKEYTERWQELLAEYEINLNQSNVTETLPTLTALLSE